MTSSDYAGYRDWKGWNQQSFGVCTKENAIYYSEELRRSGIEELAGKRILEIGFGNGQFAAWARDAGALYLGTESVDELVELAVRSGFNAANTSKPLETVPGATSLDLIVAFDVFEHLDSDGLRQTLRSAYGALRPSGRLVFRMPSGDSPFSRALQHGDATHRIIVGSSMVRQLARETNFAVESVRAPAFPLRGLGLGPFLRRAAVAVVRAAMVALIIRVFMGGEPWVLTPNMVCVLVKP